MTIEEIRQRAEALGIPTTCRNKAELVRAIQSAEGNSPCFRSGRSQCEHIGCCWLVECIPQQYAELHGLTGVGARTGKWRR